MEKKCKIIYLNNFIYILSDDEIKESDWCYDEYNKIIFKNKSTGTPGMSKKIIATTDTSLHGNYNENIGSKIYSENYVLSQPSQQFIEQYIKTYNKGEIITEVLVEYERVKITELDANSREMWDFADKLKINQDNTITIKKLKDSYSIEEVIAFGDKIRNYCKDGHKEDSLHKVFFEWDKWIEENL